MVKSISSLCGPDRRSLQGCLVCDRNTGIHYRTCLVPLFPIKCNCGSIEPLLAFPKPGRKLPVPARLLPSQSSLSCVVSQQYPFNQQGVRCFSGLEFVLMKPMPGDHVSQVPRVTTQCFLWLWGAKQPVGYHPVVVPKDAPFSHASGFTGLPVSAEKASCGCYS